MNYFIVGIGGLLGSITRYIIGRFVKQKNNRIFPLGTFIINITGAFLLGFVSNFKIGSNLYLLLTDGFLGAYTTFSTFMYEGFSLIQDNKKINAVVYILSSLILGLLGFILGKIIGWK